MSEVARTARPASAAIAWVQGDRLFVELPTKTGVPYVVAYKRTLEGLTAALNILIDKSDALPPAPAKTQVAHPAVRKVGPTFTEDQRESVRAILKAKGIL
jgi:hypothetical protein